MTSSTLAQRIKTGFAHARTRVLWLDHVVRAGIRYDRADGGRLAAAVTYYAFFAVFSMALLGSAVLRAMNSPALLASVQSYLPRSMPRLDGHAWSGVHSLAGLVAFVVLLVAGIFWVDVLRSSMRAIWQLPQYPGNFFLRQVIDLGVLTGLALLLAASLAAAVGTETLLSALLPGDSGMPGLLGGRLLATAAFVLGIGVNVVLSAAILMALPRLRMRLRRVLGPALLVAAGLEILKTAGRLYVRAVEANPAYEVVAGAVGLLVFLNVLNQLLLFAASIAATSAAGGVTDLAASAKRRNDDREPA